MNFKKLLKNSPLFAQKNYLKLWLFLNTYTVFRCNFHLIFYFWSLYAKKIFFTPAWLYFLWKFVWPALKMWNLTSPKQSCTSAWIWDIKKVNFDGGESLFYPYVLETMTRRRNVVPVPRPTAAAGGSTAVLSRTSTANTSLTPRYYRYMVYVGWPFFASPKKMRNEAKKMRNKL
jgi:hypothetical protein